MNVQITSEVLGDWKNVCKKTMFVIKCVIFIIFALYSLYLTWYLTVTWNLRHDDATIVYVICYLFRGNWDLFVFNLAGMWVISNTTGRRRPSNRFLPPKIEYPMLTILISIS